MSEVDWTRNVFVLLAPDTFVRGKQFDVLARLRALSLEPVAFRLVQMGPDLLDALYAINIADRWDTYRYRLLDRSFRIGPVMAMVFRDSAKGEGDGDGAGEAGEPYRRLAAEKGFHEPVRAAEGTIRRDLGAINSILGLLHSSDSPDEAAQESALFGVNGPGLRGVEPASALEGFLRLVAAERPAETRDFDGVLGGVRARAGRAAWADLSERGRELLVRRAGEDTLWAVGAGAEIAAELRCGPENPMRAALVGEFTPEHPRVDMAEALNGLAAYGVALDEWEHLVLESSMYFQPRRREAGG